MKSVKSISTKFENNWPTTVIHWGWVTHICVGNLTIIGSDNGLSPGQHQAIIWTNAGILLIGPMGTNLSEIWSEISYIFIQYNALENVVCQMVAIFSRPQCVKEIKVLYNPPSVKETCTIGPQVSDTMTLWHTVKQWQMWGHISDMNSQETFHN